MLRARATPTFGYPAEPFALSVLSMAALRERWRLRNGMSRGGIHSKGRDLHSQTRRSRLRSLNNIDIKLPLKKKENASTDALSPPQSRCMVRVPRTMLTAQNIRPDMTTTAPNQAVSAYRLCMAQQVFLSIPDCLAAWAKLMELFGGLAHSDRSAQGYFPKPQRLYMSFMAAILRL